MKLKQIFRNILALTTILFTAHFAEAQSAGTNQIGLRLGGFSGINFRHIGESNVGIDLTLSDGFHSDWTMLSGLVEKHIPLGKGFVFYLGGGGFFAFDYVYAYEESHHRIYYWTEPDAGLEAVIGVDYYIPNVPLNIGIDVRPRFALMYAGYPWDGAFSFRYIF